MKHAIVIGSSIAGLLAARALSEHFEHVTILERDNLSDKPEPRKGVPQGQHAHGLLAAGLQSIEALFPGITKELIAAGAMPGDIAANIRYFQFGGYKLKSTSGLTGLSLSRPLLESQIKSRVGQLQNIQFIENRSVIGLTASNDRSQITGVKLSLESSSIGENLTADLVVDASGRGSQTPVWLEVLGYAKPVQSLVEINMGYTSRIYQRRPDDLNGDIAALIVAKAPEQKRTGAMMSMEGNRWMMTIAGTLGDHAPTDEAGFLEALKNLPAPDAYNVLKNAKPLSEIVSFKYPHNQRRFYEKLERFPKGFLVFGDAICSFNPIYGQGMSVSALEALALQSELRVGVSGIAKRFFARAASIIETPWTIAVGEDLRYPEVDAPRSVKGKFINWYVSKVQIASRTDSVVCNAFHRVANLLESPPSLFAPQLVARVIRANLAQPKPQPAALQQTRATT